MTSGGPYMAEGTPSTTVSATSGDLYPKIVLYHLQLHLAPGGGRDRLPAYLRATVRGLLAASFRQLVCDPGAP
jgi:hypothetical protein